jgi:hypothetical protein
VYLVADWQCTGEALGGSITVYWVAAFHCIQH